MDLGRKEKKIPTPPCLLRKLLLPYYLRPPSLPSPSFLPFDGFPDLSRPGGNPPGRRATRVPSCWSPVGNLCFFVPEMVAYQHAMMPPTATPRPPLDLVQGRRGLQF